MLLKFLQQESTSEVLLKGQYSMSQLAFFFKSVHLTMALCIILQSWWESWASNCHILKIDNKYPDKLGGPRTAGAYEDVRTGTYFGRLVNPITIRGRDRLHPIYMLVLTIFLTFRRHWRPGPSNRIVAQNWGAQSLTALVIFVIGLRRRPFFFCGYLSIVIS